MIEEAVEKSSRVKLNAYNQDGHKCRKCSSVISKIKVGQRSAHFCPVCQIKDATLWLNNNIYDKIASIFLYTKMKIE